MKVLTTGGAGYIGSHTIIKLIEAGHEPVVVDNLSNSSVESLKRVEKITGQTVPFHEFDVRDHAKLYALFAAEGFDAVIHFAGLKAVGESVAMPLEYYGTNLDSTLVLLDVMRSHDVKKIIFSSSASVYGVPGELPLTETGSVGVGITNPYGWSKFMNEQILRDTALAADKLEVTILRYFNPVGAHPSGFIGEDPQGTPNNLLPYISQTAVGKQEYVSVFGDDYETPDGTGVRDYIHVVDLAAGHVAALNHMKPGAEVYNLGTGQGTSVFELIKAFEEAAGKKIPYKICPRRPGDVAENYASAEKAKRDFGWTAKKTIHEACADAWHWQSKNPNGYQQMSS